MLHESQLTDLMSSVTKSAACQDMEMLVEKNGGAPPDSMKAFESLLGKVGLPAAPAEDPPEKLTGPGPELKKTKDVYDSVPSLKDLGYEEAATTSIHVRSRLLYDLPCDSTSKQIFNSFEPPSYLSDVHTGRSSSLLTVST